MRSATAAIVAVVLLTGGGSADEGPEIEGAADRASYSLGYQMGGDLRRDGTEIDADALLQGLRDAQGGTDPSIPPEQMNAILLELKQRIEALEQGQRPQTAEKRRDEGRQFLATNAKKEGVVALASGLQYRVLGEGTGSRPGPSDKVAVHYRSTLIDGTEFHNSYQREDEPETLHVSGVIRGLSEALQLMREGARWQVFIPADLAYGRRGPLADRTVIYEIELISIVAGE
jgi:FKBP-type peptidyl-prolyl cis-trans isomerase FklB